MRISGEVKTQTLATLQKEQTAKEKEEKKSSVTSVTPPPGGYQSKEFMRIIEEQEERAKEAARRVSGVRPVTLGAIDGQLPPSSGGSDQGSPRAASSGTDARDSPSVAGPSSSK